MESRTFKVRAVNRDGETIELTLHGNSQSEIQEELTRRGLFPLGVKESADKSGFFTGKGRKLSDYELIFFFRQLLAMLSAGITIGEAIRILSEKLTDPKMKTMFLKLNESLTEGKSFSKAILESGYNFHPLIASFVRQGEQSGDLAEVFKRLIIYWERRRNAFQKIIDAIIYPLVLLAIVFGIVCFLLLHVVPTFTNMYSDFSENLPAFTRMVIYTSDLIRYHFTLVVAAGVFGLFLIYEGLKHQAERMLNMISGFPLIRRFYYYYRLSYFSLALGSLLKSGMSVDDSLSVLQDGFQGGKVAKVREVLHGGVSLSESLKPLNLYNEVNLQMVTVGENTGRLGEVFLNLGEFYESELDYSLRRMLSLFEPLLILLMGMVVGFIVLSMFLPIVQMAALIK
ncbi:MAG: type II secretion system F family protein [Candidatus Wallbacteria bacterium]|nr:type II secretion system F family protein [Candidatus Wallbacteria bacterium]